MPFCGATVSVPPRPVPPIKASVTGLVAVVTMFPPPSSTATCIAGEIVAPVSAFDGCCRNAKVTGVGLPPPDALMVKRLLVAGVRPELVADNV